MAKVELRQSWGLQVQNAELTLIRKALGGRLRPEDLGQALALDRELAQQVVAQTRQASEEVEKLARNLNQAS